MHQCLTCSVSEDLSEQPQHLGVLSGKQLFVDDYLLALTSGVERVLSPPIYHPTPVMDSTDGSFERQGR